MKRFLAMILVVALVLSVPIPPAAATQEENVTVVGEMCPCGCGKASEEIVWKPWTVNDTGAPADGHYYLAEDYAQKGQHTIMAGDRVVLDLRGKTLTTEGYSRLFLVYGYLAVMDTVGGGRMSAKTSGAAYGGIVMVGQNETVDPTFVFHSGTMTPDADNKSSLAGGLVTVGFGCHFIMHGGLLLGGSTTQAGGAIRGSSTSSDIQILGGSIIGCRSTEAGGAIFSYGNTTLKNCLLSGNEASGTSKGFGGNIYAEGGTLTIENAIIEHGVSNATSNGGGNIFALGNCKVSIKDSTIRNGYTANNGGNLCFGTCTQTLENVKLYGGSAARMGANLYVNSASAKTTIIGGEIAGDIHYANAKLTLKGAVKIGMNSSGLKLGDGTVLSASGLTDGAEIYIDTAGTFTEAGTNPAYFKGALRTVVSETDSGLKGTRAASGEAGGYCPHCGEVVTWTAVSGTPSGHCYLTASATPSTAYAITTDTVLDLRGYSITSSQRVYTVAAGSSLTLLDSVGGSSVKGSGVASEAGGVIHNSGTLTIYGGKYLYNAGKTVSSGGVIYSDGNVTIHGGVYDGSAYSNTASTALGAVVNMSAGSRSFTMTAGRMLGGKAYRGGTCCFGSTNTVTVTGGSFQGGTAANATGNLRFNGSTGRGNLQLSNVLVSGGTGEYAGAIGINYYNAQMDHCLVLNGTGTSYGGNISIGTHGYLDATGCFVSGGKAPKGGNLYTASYLGAATLTDCTLIGGQATTAQGGNLMVNHGNVNFYGGVIAYGTAKTIGGNVHTNGGNHTDAGAKDDGFRLYASEKGMPLITTGTAGTKGGNIYSSGVTVLDAAFINNGAAETAGNDIYYDMGANIYSLTVGAGLTGKMYFATAAALLSSSEVVNSAAVSFPGQLILEGEMGEPALTVKDGKLMLGGIALFKADGNVDWFVELADALTAYSSGSYIKIFADGSLTLTKDCMIDLNGKTLTVSGNYTVYGMDSSGDGYTESTGKLILTEGAEAALRTTVFDGREYISITNENEATCHRLGMQVTDVTLRPDACGVYYKASWDCDPTLAALIDSYGLTLSVYHEPGEKFAEDKLSVETTYDGAELVSGEKKTGVLIRGIMKDSLADTENDSRGQIPIYAKAYLEMKDGTQLLSGSADYSLKSAMERLDSLISSDPTHYRRYTNDGRAFYETWKEMGMNDWQFVNLKEPEEDDVLELLMIGSSGCYYYVEELHGLAAAAGIRLRVCNVYYSGCLLSQHYNWWMNNESKYQFFVTDENGRRQTNNVSLEYCLAQGDWDFISLQESGTAKLRVGEAQTLLAEREVYLTTLYTYLGEQFPDAKLYWQQNGAYQKGYNQSFTITTTEQQAEDTRHYREFAKAIAEKYHVEWIPRGEASQIYREIPGIEDNLCARLGINNDLGDYYHDGDIGGGQYLTACVWFEMLTGESCIGNTWRPDYTLAEEKILLLQECAHQAVENLKAGLY